jgi:Protein of unknown function (DUF3119)
MKLHLGSVLAVTLSGLLVVSRVHGFVVGTKPTAPLQLGTNSAAVPSLTRPRGVPSSDPGFDVSIVSTTAPARIATQLHQSSASNSNDSDAVIIDSDFRLAGIFLAAGLLADAVPYLQVTLGPIITLLGLLFLVQTFRLKFVCDESSFSLQNESREPGENPVVGGENRWAYRSFVNYDFFPEGWIDQPQGPILVYFKETQTPSETWYDGPGKSANSEQALARGAVPGQVHFFPALCNAQQLRAEWEKRGCQKL